MLSITKPVTEFIKLDAQLSSYGTHFDVSCKKQVLYFSESNNDNVVVIRSGTVSLRRGGAVLIGFAEAPVITGLANSIIEANAHYQLVSEANCSGYYLPASVGMKVIEENNLWREAFCWLAWHSRVMELRDLQLIGNSSYDQIRVTLMSMMEWDETLRYRVGVMNYIHQRTCISRSVVAEVLSALRKGGYIEMKQGKLIAVNHLPAEY
ncbi:TPA: helix-turn-helix domain-containing protein [Citrobacter farmeri]|uniref:helix-turn-helix domain-containing protein n=1 Tax=Citrobacter farmeri TaxID=67824 RepID=UPI001A22AAC5|nr:helix-turn-helix domain-containing protein [Citrobacter farmeri]MBU5647939.1 helix-turn-helix domain-containing protein [Pluralibacter sp. S54_ASV_43]HAT3754193.1 transcriptional regulator [Citrobacter amalonaticus]HAU5705546.1 transcriptional regulator [Citrobacter freundii]QZE48592.1 helix-turn-helix domain-containing protein [Citrobacter farmeri]HCB1598829.1 helix-turn-helix domain-containing protein [Citrobacter farmeri]